MKKVYSFVVLMFLIGQTTFAQNVSSTDLSAIQQHFNSLSQSKSTSASIDYAEFQITGTASSLAKGVKHFWVEQLYQGIPIINSNYKISLKNGQLNHTIDQFITGLDKMTITAKSSNNAASAIRAVIQAHGMKSAQLNKTMMKSAIGEDIAEFKNSGITQDNEPITAKQVYIYHNDELRLAWNVNIYEKGGDHWWNSVVDMATNKILTEDDWVISCSFDNHDHANHNHSSVLEEEMAGPLTKAATAALAPDSYNVYPMPIESPSHGGRSIVVDPADTTASPFGWHDDNGVAGAEFTTTRGNNVHAQDDSNGNNGTGFAPSGGTSLDFDFPVNLNQAPSTYRDASIVNLFYWNNIIHDVLYQYGFDEASGNFQEDNYGRGGRAGDFVFADAQDGSGTNNANFGTPPDGSNPRMQMFLWNRTRPGRDGSFDNVIIVHEYGHGISTRLVGGPGRNVLGGSEQMGEGWSDYYGLMLTMRAGDTGTDARGVGSYVLGQPTSGAGIRPTRYSIDRSVNNSDYADIGGLARPHGVGYAFATILWDMTWLIINQEGFDPDFYNGTGGNNIALALVTEGLKNTASNPGFVSGRDGILQADQDLYNGRYACLIWKAFAERGVGETANENNNGGTNGQTDQTVSFDLPASCTGGGPDPDPDPVPDTCSGDVASFPFNASFETNLGQWSNTTVGDDIDWTRDSGGTPSRETGPSTGADGDFYMYVEASGNNTGFPNKSAFLNSPCLNFSSLSAPTLSFSYHMFGSAINSLNVEARANNDGDWVSVFSRTGAQGNQWNAADVDLSAYAGAAIVQLRFNVVTGSGGSGWQSDIAIDAVSIQEASGPGDPGPACDSLNFNDFTISSFSNQDAAGDSSIGNAGASLSLTNNTWKFIALNYTVTANTVIEFDFTSSSQGEIHGVGFENDNTLTQNRYFKVHGTQNYGVRNFDNYAGGTTTYTIPVGSFYTGAMDRLVFINDNDAGSGNTSTFSNVKIFEGTCGGSAVAAFADFGDVTPVLGDGIEGALSTFALYPNPATNSFSMHVGSFAKGRAFATIYSVLGQVQSEISLNQGVNVFSTKELSLQSGIYLIKIEMPGEESIMQKLIIK